MKKLRLLLVLGVMLLIFTSISSADSLEVIGTASYLGSNYNLIYEEAQGLVWLDYTQSGNTWQNQVAWASGLGANLTITLNPGYTTNIDWTTGWRLPSAGNNPVLGYNQTTSEMGHLYYDSLSKPADGPLGDTSPFDNLQADIYWSGTEYLYPSLAWYFYFYNGTQSAVGKSATTIYALAVRPGDVSTAAVPEPATMMLLGMGLAGLGFMEKLRRRRG